MTDMSPIEAQIVELRNAELTHAMIGERLGITTETVDSNVKKLRKAGIDLPSRRGNGASSDWTPDLVKKLRALYAQGKSGGIIAKELGGGFSRNAVIGKLTRLGLVGRGNPCVRKASQKLTQRRKPSVAPTTRQLVPAAPEPPVAIVEPVTTKISGHIGLMDLRDATDFSRGTCKWPIGDPGDKDFGFCGAQPELGKPYCAYHCRIAYQPRRSAA